MVSHIFETDWLQIQSNIMRRDVFQAIADPTRRAIINMIAHQPLNLNAVAEKFDVSRPAISKHIKILTQCGLVAVKQQGRERFCEAKLQKLNEVSEWIEQYRVFWTNKLDALENFLAREDIADNKNNPFKKPKRK
jgi:DNA-binding transcriptional ArsR family regulator